MAKDNRLEFRPARDWPIGQHYTVTVGERALAAHIAITTRQFGFTSPAFVAQISQAEFYQDPVKADVRRALFQVRFSHPVNTAEFERRLTLTGDASCSTALLSFGTCPSLKFTVIYDKLRLAATIQSEPSPIPEKTQPVSLSLAAGAESHYGLSLALGGGEVTSEELAGMYAMLINGGISQSIRYTYPSSDERPSTPLRL